MAFFHKKDTPKINVDEQKHDIPKNIWIKCPQSGDIIYSKELGSV